MKNTSLESVAILGMGIIGGAYTLYCFMETISIIINHYH